MAALMRPTVSSSAELPRISSATTSAANGHLSKDALHILPTNISSSGSGDMIPVSGGLISKDPSAISGAANTLGNVAGGILAGLQCPSMTGSSLHNVFKWVIWDCSSEERHHNILTIAKCKTKQLYLLWEHVLYSRMCFLQTQPKHDN